MPSSILKPCAHPGCRELVSTGSRCAAHQSQQRREQDADRVWFIYTPKSAAPAQQDAASVDVMLLQAKCRNGPAGIQLPITFHRRSMAFAR